MVEVESGSSSGSSSDEEPEPPTQTIAGLEVEKKEEKKKIRRRRATGDEGGKREKDEEDQPVREGFFGWLSSIKMGPLLMIIFMFGPGIFGGALWMYDFAYPTAAAPGGAAGTRGHEYKNPIYYQDQIEGIYRQHNPSKIAELPKLLAKYKGREGQEGTPILPCCLCYV
jgi:hypothetical protein